MNYKVDCRATQSFSRVCKLKVCEEQPLALLGRKKTFSGADGLTGLGTWQWKKVGNDDFIYNEVNILLSQIISQVYQGIVLLMIVELETRRVVWRNLCPGGARYLRPVGHSTVKDDQEEVIRYSIV